MSLRAELALILLPALCGLVDFAVAYAWRLRAGNDRLDRLARQIDQAVLAGRRVHELQIERGLSAGSSPPRVGASAKRSPGSVLPPTRSPAAMHGIRPRLPRSSRRGEPHHRDSGGQRRTRRQGGCATSSRR